MFIVKRGTLKVVNDEVSSPSVILKDGATFGELSVIHIAGNQLGDRRAVSLRSEGYSDVYILNQDDVSAILQEYPKDRDMLIANARAMLRSRNLLSEEIREDADEPQNMLSLDEQLLKLKRQINEFDYQLNSMYSSFNEFSTDMKRRVTSLENIYRDHRSQIKQDCFRGLL
uniref:Cyclic nucleotide-binding domain-containing protein n=1 Tax=Heterorhabditis bacteriophora TaxID=37862 RepID=A0A1I7WUU6_HETBA